MNKAVTIDFFILVVLIVDVYISYLIYQNTRKE